MAEELQLNQSEARQLAFEMLQANDKEGEVVIERRHSPYYGEFEHYMTCSYSGELG